MNILQHHVRLKETCIETIDIKFSVHDISGIAFIITDQTEILFNAALNIYNPTHKGLHWVKIWNINNISVLSHFLNDWFFHEKFFYSLRETLPLNLHGLSLRLQNWIPSMVRCIWYNYTIIKFSDTLGFPPSYKRISHEKISRFISNFPKTSYRKLQGQFTYFFLCQVNIFLCPCH
jgi:hypothetical protein